jgi:hypothetical protein
VVQKAPRTRGRFRSDNAKCISHLQKGFCWRFQISGDSTNHANVRGEYYLVETVLHCHSTATPSHMSAASNILRLAELAGLGSDDLSAQPRLAALLSSLAESHLDPHSGCSYSVLAHLHQVLSCAALFSGFAVP